MRSVAALIVVLGALAALPAAARADDPCADDAALCDGARPLPDIAMTPRAPRAGAAIGFTASSPGRGIAFAWDLDGDGDYDDAAGAHVDAVLAAGTPVVGVRATDDAGRSATLRQSVPVHGGDLAPTGGIAVAPLSARVGRPVTVTAGGSDPDGRIAKVELDLDGDGAYEVVAGGAPRVARTVTFATAGMRVLRERLTDDAGVSSVATRTTGRRGARSRPPARSTTRSSRAPGSP